MHPVNIATASSLEDFDDIIDNWHFRLRGLKIWLIAHPGDLNYKKAEQLAGKLIQRIREMRERYNQAIIKQAAVKAQDTSGYRGYETA